MTKKAKFVNWYWREQKISAEDNVEMFAVVVDKLMGIRRDVDVFTLVHFGECKGNKSSDTPAFA